jgi:hypothetical protein
MRRALVTLALLAFGLSAGVSAQLTGPQSVLVNPINTVNEPTQTYTQAELQAVFAPGASRLCSRLRVRALLVRTELRIGLCMER